MEKRKFNIKLITNNEEKEYILLGAYDSKKRIIHYNENEDIVTSMTINLQNKELIRENKDYCIKYKLIENKETINEVFMKEMNKSFDIRIKTEKFEITDNKVEIVYNLLGSNEKLIYEINM